MTTLTLFIKTATQTFNYNINGDKATITGPDGKIKTIIIGDRSFDNSIRRACMDIANQFLEEVRTAKNEKIADRARLISEERDKKKKEQEETFSKPSSKNTHL